LQPTACHMIMDGRQHSHRSSLFHVAVYRSAPPVGRLA
jgi:hypothetical protein